MPMRAGPPSVGPMKRVLFLPVALALIAACGALAAPAGAVSVTEYPQLIPASLPQGIAPGPDGNVWFVENRGSRFGRIVPSTGRIDDWSTGSGISAGSQPSELTPGPDGNLWFTEEAGNRIGRIKVGPPPTATEFPVTGQPEGITSGPDGNLWFTEFGGDAIARITPSGTVTGTFGTGTKSMPLGIAAGPDGNIWFTDLRFEDNPVARFTLSSGGPITEFSAGIASASEPARIVAGPDGNLWFTEQNAAAVGRITPAGQVTEFTNGISKFAGPVGITVGPDGNLWFAEYGGSSGRRIGRITPAGVVTEFSAGITDAPLDITLGPDGNLWFTEYYGNRLGKVVLSPEVTTGGASGVTSNSATVAGTVNTVGTATTYVVEYGTTTNYGKSTSSHALKAGGTPASVSVPLSGLQPNTRYHYRLVAANTQGTTTGADRTFTTASGPSSGSGSSTLDKSGPKVAVTGPASTGMVPVDDSLVTINIGCPLSETLGCRGSVTMETVAKLSGKTASAAALHRLKLGSARFRVAAGQKSPVKVRLSHAGRALVRKKHRLRVRVIVTARDGAGNRSTTVRVLTLSGGKLR
jgi:streptogramin lyase